MGWYSWINKCEVWETTAAQDIFTDPKYLRRKDFLCGRYGGDTQSHYYVWRHNGSCREQQINLPCWQLQSQGHSVSIRRLHLPLPGQTVCVLSSILCALTPGIHTHTSFDTTVLVNTPVCLHTVCCHRSAAGAKLEDGLTCQKILPHPTHNMGRCWICIHRTVDLMSVIISGGNLLFHRDRADPEKLDKKSHAIVCTNDRLYRRGNGIMGREEACLIKWGWTVGAAGC